jgi:RecB family exonuclease
MTRKLNLSPASVRMWMECPYAFALDRVAKVPRYQRVITPQMHTGRAVHTVLEQIAKQPELSAEFAESSLERTFSWDAYADRAEAEVAYQTARERLATWLVTPYGREAGQLLAVEKMLRSPERDGLVLSGRPDLVRVYPDDTIEVVDHKSGLCTPSAEELKGEPQAAIYRILAEVHWPGYPNYRVTFSYLATGTTVPVQFGCEEVEAWWEFILDVAERIRKARAQVEGDLHLEEAFEPQPGARCARCMFRKVCTFRSV